MYAILCATAEEFEALTHRLHLHPEPTRHGPTEVWTGEHDGEPVVLARSGIGKVNAAAAATLLLSRYAPDLLIFSGVAGGLDPELPVGSVLLADRMAIHDYGVISAGRFTATPSGMIPLGAPPLNELVPVPRAVAAILRRLAEAIRPGLEAPVRLGGLLTGDYFLNCSETRADLHARFGAQAIDMESGALHQVAHAWGVPLYVIRTLSDLAGEESHVTYPQMAQMAARNSALCVVALLEILRADPPPT